MKKKIVCLMIIFFIVFLFVFSFVSNDKFNDSIRFDGKEYFYLEYRNDIFYYDLNNLYEFEVDVVNRIEHNKWDMIYFNGDVFVAREDVSDAIKYYNNDDNYEWYIVIDEEYDELKKKISINSDELEYLYDIDNKKKDITIVFDDIEKFGSIRKVSEDGFISGVMSICYCGGSWYWKSEVMTDDDKEYVVELPNSLISKF